mgnify:CR=1 FL=1
MGKPTGFLEYARELPADRSPKERLSDWEEFHEHFPAKKLREQGAAEAPGYFLACSLRPRELTYCNCINHGPNDGLNVLALSAAETDLRGRMFEAAEIFRKHIAG